MKVRFPIDKIPIKHASDIYEIMKMVLKKVPKMDRDKEHFWVLALNKANKIVNLELVALGANDRLSAQPADIFAIPLQKQAKGVILVHNHPTGSLKPSEADKDFTDWMVQAGRIMEVPVLDHVIISEESYLSFEEIGLLERLEASSKYIPPYELEKMSYQGGREEREEEIAKQMIEDGEPMEKIKKWTGLSIEKLEELLNTSKETI